MMIIFHAKFCKSFTCQSPLLPRGKPWDRSCFILQNSKSGQVVVLCLIFNQRATSLELRASRFFSDANFFFKCHHPIETTKSAAGAVGSGIGKVAGGTASVVGGTARGLSCSAPSAPTRFLRWSA